MNRKQETPANVSLLALPFSSKQHCAEVQPHRAATMAADFFSPFCLCEPLSFSVLNDFSSQVALEEQKLIEAIFGTYSTAEQHKMANVSFKYYFLCFLCFKNKACTEAI